MTSFKLLVIGDTAVGRTSFIHRFIHKEDVNLPDFLATIGASFHQIDIEGRDCNTYKLNIWEINGLIEYISLAGMYFRNSSGFLLLFDVTRKRSFDDAIRNWMDQISLNAPADVPVILVGTKCDLNEERVISQDRIHTVCDEMNLLYIEVSAKEGINVDFAFTEILEEMICFEKLKFTRYSQEIRVR